MSLTADETLDNYVRSYNFMQGKTRAFCKHCKWVYAKYININMSYCH